MREAATVLVVDNDLRVLFGLARALGHAYDVTFAASADEARARLSEETIDVVLTDSDLGGSSISGVELLEEVAKAWPETRRVLFTRKTRVVYSSTAVQQLRFGFQHAIEVNRQLGVELSAATIDQLLNRAFAVHRPPVNAVGRHGVKRIRNRNHP